MSDALTFNRRAIALWKQIKEIQNETLSGEDATADVTDAILKAFQDIETLVEESYKKVQPVQEISDQ